jgi:hypothetical protein
MNKVPVCCGAPGWTAGPRRMLLQMLCIIRSCDPAPDLVSGCMCRLTPEFIRIAIKKFQSTHEIVIKNFSSRSDMCYGNAPAFVKMWKKRKTRTDPLHLNYIGTQLRCTDLE